MADYYPLISRAVANLGQSTPEQRRDLYTRATGALLGQLRNSDPPIADAEIERERAALEDAVRRVETEVAGGVTRGEFDSTAAPLPPAETLPEARPPDDVPLPEETERPVRRAIVPDLTETSGDGATGWRDTGAMRPRPPAPRIEIRDRRWIRAAVIGLAIAVVVGLTAGAAIMLKHQPSEFLPQKNAPAASAPEGDSKFQDRLAGDAAVAPPPVAPTAPSAPAQTTPSQAGQPGPGAAPQVAQAAPAAAPPIGVLQRVLLIEQPPEGSQEVRQSPGRVRWRVDSVASGPGEPLDVAVRGEIEVPDAAMKLDLLIRRNRDAALPASHTIEMKFTPAAGGSGPVRDVGVPEMRQDEAQRGTPLAGIAVPVTDNLFLTGLSNLGPDVQRNLELLRGRNWFMVPLRFASGRRALLLIEKGATGSRTITDALQSWQQG